MRTQDQELTHPYSILALFNAKGYCFANLVRVCSIHIPLGYTALQNVDFKMLRDMSESIW